MPTCGPAVATALCRDCALEVGADAWCEGHRPAGTAVLAALADLPPEWDDVTRLWWVATGEVRLDALVRRPATGLPPAVAAVLGDGGSDG